jgi:hypothetical protein
VVRIVIAVLCVLFLIIVGILIIAGHPIPGDKDLKDFIGGGFLATALAIIALLL